MNQTAKQHKARPPVLTDEAIADIERLTAGARDIGIKAHLVVGHNNSNCYVQLPDKMSPMFTGLHEARLWFRGLLDGAYEVESARTLVRVVRTGALFHVNYRKGLTGRYTLMDKPGLPAYRQEEAVRIAAMELAGQGELSVSFDV